MSRSQTKRYDFDVRCRFIYEGPGEKPSVRQLVYWLKAKLSGASQEPPPFLSITKRLSKRDMAAGRDKGGHILNKNRDGSALVLFVNNMYVRVTRVRKPLR